jgi:hypothetical protein
VTGVGRASSTSASQLDGNDFVQIGEYYLCADMTTKELLFCRIYFPVELAFGSPTSLGG